MTPEPIFLRCILPLFFAIFGKITVFAAPAPTFNRDIAPIVFANCVGCHHPGGIGPFSLAEYGEVKKRAKLIAGVTGRRFMPPWLPEHGHGDFVGERRLTDEEIAVIDRWWKAGAPEGAAADLTAKPTWNDDWQLGKPDLVVTMPQPYTLRAEGPDEYRNFVIPSVVFRDRYVRAVEIRPGNPQVVHHVALLLDSTGDARARAAKESAPGFPGMNAGRGAGRPEGHLVTWQPGKRILPEPAGTAWLLPQRTDLVLQLHLRPSGKPERVQASIALYFVEQKPARECFTVLVRSTTFEIPPGAADFAIESAYKLPVEVEVLGVFPHLHYLGKEVHGWAELPDGTRQELIFIKQWDFNWQGDYHYATPPLLPKGTTVKMRYTYDNSAGNIRNPNHPPKPVQYGPETGDEMGDLFLQLLPRNPADLDTLRRDYAANYGLPDSIAFAEAMLRHDPKDAESRTDLGAALLLAGQVDDAIKELRHAAFDDPKLPRPHYALAQIRAARNDLPGAKAELTRVLELDPNDANAHNNFGYLLLVEGQISTAIEHFEQALRLNPADTLARTNLQKAKALLPKR